MNKPRCTSLEYRYFLFQGLTLLTLLTSLFSISRADPDCPPDCPLKGLTKLERLDLGDSRKLTDAGLAHLKGLTKLEQLDLRECGKITDAGLAHLKGLTKLKMLSLRQCDRITKAGIAELKKALPNTTIID